MEKILYPSAGGTGIRLKIARPILVIEMIADKALVVASKEICPIYAKTKDRHKFTKTPAIETTNEPSLYGFKLCSETGTGFAQPASKLDPESISIAGTTTLPKISMWGIGFKVSLF